MEVLIYQSLGDSPSIKYMDTETNLIQSIARILKETAKKYRVFDSTFPIGKFTLSANRIMEILQKEWLSEDDVINQNKILIPRLVESNIEVYTHYVSRLASKLRYRNGSRKPRRSPLGLREGLAPWMN